MVVCYWGISQSQTTTQLAGNKHNYIKTQQQNRNIVTSGFLRVSISILKNFTPNYLFYSGLESPGPAAAGGGGEECGGGGRPPDHQQGGQAGEWAAGNTDL